MQYPGESNSCRIKVVKQVVQYYHGSCFFGFPNKYQIYTEVFITIKLHELKSSIRLLHLAQLWKWKYSNGINERATHYKVWVTSIRKKKKSLMDIYSKGCYKETALSLMQCQAQRIKLFNDFLLINIQDIEEQRRDSVTPHKEYYFQTRRECLKT